MFHRPVTTTTTALGCGVLACALLVGLRPGAHAEDPSAPVPQVVISDRFTEARLGPLYAALTLVDGRLLRSGRRRIALEIVNQSDAPVHGTLRVLKTAAWEITPGMHFEFALDPGERLFQDFRASLPAYVGPGLYDFVVRMGAGGRDVGSLRASLVKPIDWLVIGPFEPPAAGERLEPESGVNLDGLVDGLDGRVAWRTVPDFAFDASGRLELDLVYGAAQMERCACAFTTFEATNTEALEWDVDGADVVLLNGRPLEPGHFASVRRGRNTVLARVCDRQGTWRLGLSLLDRDGAWVRGIDNDLSTLLDGFEAIRGNDRERGAAHRQWLFEYFNPNASDVRVLGSFNGWVPLELSRTGDGTWKRDLLLPPGRYAYKLSVDGHLDLDPNAERAEPDGFGGLNSVLIIR